MRHDLLDYYFEVQRFDRDLGRIIDTLDRAGELDRTLIIVTSDNGMPFPRGKANVYDAGARLPFAMRWPGVIRAGTVVDDFVSLTDVAPTVLEAAGLKPLEAMMGRSVLPLLRGESQPGRDRVFIERERHANVRQGDLSYPMRAIRTKDQAIASFFRLATAKRPAEELYDLKNDPQQLDNVAARPAYRDAMRCLRTELDRCLRETGDPRATADDDRWDRFPYYGQPAK